jgi:hypothetical protein
LTIAAFQQPDPNRLPGLDAPVVVGMLDEQSVLVEGAPPPADPDDVAVAACLEPPPCVVVLAVPCPDACDPPAEVCAGGAATTLV